MIPMVLLDKQGMVDWSLGLGSSSNGQCCGLWLTCSPVVEDSTIPRWVVFEFLNHQLTDSMAHVGGQSHAPSCPPFPLFFLTGLQVNRSSTKLGFHSGLSRSPRRIMMINDQWWPLFAKKHSSRNIPIIPQLRNTHTSIYIYMQQYVCNNMYIYI